MSWFNIGKAFSDIENPPNPSRPLIISRCRMRHFINLWYPKSLFLSNFVLSLASFITHPSYYTIQYSAITSNNHIWFGVFRSLLFFETKSQKISESAIHFFCRSPSLPRLFTLRPLASIWIFHILALIMILFFLWCV